jgi:hypothetical protein
MKLKMSFMVEQYNSFGIRQVFNTLSCREENFFKITFAYWLFFLQFILYLQSSLLNNKQPSSENNFAPLWNYLYTSTHQHKRIIRIATHFMVKLIFHFIKKYTFSVIPQIPNVSEDTGMEPKTRI